MAAVYILGAGSSACLGAPLLRDFRAAAERARSAPLPTRTTMSMGFSLALSAWDALGDSANVEDLYTLAVLQGRLGVTGRERLADDVAYLIAKTLVHSMDFGDLEYHRSVIDRVGQGDTIISLNWDIALDLAARAQKRPLNLGYEKSREMGGSTNLHGWPVRLFKLHGSHNWMFCADCRTLWHATSAQASLASWQEWESAKCEDCTGELQPLVLPPSPEKLSGEASALHAITEVWMAARNALRNASSVTIVGYSFPRTDVQFGMFILDAIADNSALQVLDIVTERKYGQDRVDTEEHFARIFRGSKHYGRLGFHYVGFEKWARPG